MKGQWAWNLQTLVVTGHRPENWAIAIVLTLNQFSDLWEGTFNELVTQAKRFGLDESTAEDVVQDIAIEAMHKLQRFSDGMHFRKWAHKTLRFRCIDQFTELVPKQLGDPADESTAGVSRASAVNDWDRDVRKCIENLPKQQREVLERLAAGNLPKEIAKALQVNVSTVRSLKRHGLARIKSLLPQFDKQLESDHE